MPSEGMMLTRIAVDCRVWFFGKYGLDLSLRRLGNELVLLGQMHQQRRIEPVDLAQIFLGVTAVIDDRSFDAIAGGRQECHQAAEAVTENGNLTSALRQLCHGVGVVLNIARA